jgi:hypothetical protein
MAQSKPDKAADDVSSYAARHPRRMYSTMLMVGTALGASVMAAKKNHDKNALQKFIDNINR